MEQTDKELTKPEQIIERILDAHGTAIVIEKKRKGAATHFNDAAKNLLDEIQSLYNLAFLDGLTQVPNRMRLKDDFAQMEHEIAAGKKCGAVAIFDIDFFKKVNDTYGHSIGDTMLQRLAEQLNGKPQFKERLYRLGGDEFALLLSVDTEAHPDLWQHFEEILSGALDSYTLPNIDLSCTLSMGVALYPQHGDTLTALLHRADIALYKAKTAGRNRLELFKDEDEIIKDLKDIYINIQPVLDAGGKTFGYELTEGSAESDKKAQKTSLIDFNRTLDVLGLEEMDNNNKYFVSYTKNMAAATGLDRLKSKLIMQIDVTDYCGDEELQNCMRLKELGFTIALNCSDKDYLSDALLAVAEYVKVTPGMIADEDVKHIILKNGNITFIGYHIDDSNQLSAAKKARCGLFQGQFFKEAQTITKKTKDIEPLQANYFRLLKLTCTEKFVDFSEISDIISSDLALSFKLLKLMNSVALGMRTPVSSIPMAVTYLGEERLKKWIALMSLRGITSEKPIELIRISLIRAKFGENLIPHFKVPRNPDHVFMVGMLSLLHVALGKEQKELMDEISLAEDIRESLLGKNGRYSDLLEFFRNYEHSHWFEVSKFAKDNNLSTRVINEAYLAATKWFDELTREK